MDVFTQWGGSEVWSPRELAELAGTSRRTVRHYDEIGLLPAPDRQGNGYGRYGVVHLIRLLRIRRLSTLGLSLPQIAALGDSQPPPSLIRSLDDDLRGRVEELQRAREELASMLERPGPVELPAVVAQHVAHLPTAQRAVLVVMSRILDDAALDAYVGLLVPYRKNRAVAAFDALPDQVEPAARSDVADGIATHFTRFRSQHAPAFEMIERSMRHGVSKQRTIDEAVRELYNPAQRDVLRRLSARTSHSAFGLRQPQAHGLGSAAPRRSVPA